MTGKRHLRKFQSLELFHTFPNRSSRGRERTVATPGTVAASVLPASACPAKPWRSRATGNGFRALLFALLALPLFAAEPVDDATMQRVYETVQTPHKVGVVLRGPVLSIWKSGTQE